MSRGVLELGCSTEWGPTKSLPSGICILAGDRQQHFEQMNHSSSKETCAKKLKERGELEVRGCNLNKMPREGPTVKGDS